jgi:predicted  nucleic acid-binding Zn-ribbon protein
MTKLASQIEKQDALLKTQAQEIQQLNEQKSNFELQIKQLSIELNDTKVRFQNSTSLIQHSCKANTLLKEEKDSLEKILQDSAIKLKNLKTECDEVKEKHSKLEGQHSELQSDYDIKIKKLNEFQKLNEILSNEKEECIKVSFSFIFKFIYYGFINKFL